MSKEKKSIAQNMGITRTVIRPREECDIQLREDRIGKYFKKYLNKFVFVEFSEDFMKKSKAGDLMRGDPEEAVQLQAVRRHDEGRARCCRTR